MSILLDQSSRVVVQGITGKEGGFHAERMIEYGTRVVAGVTPGKGGRRHLDRPVFDSVAQAVDREGANASIIFVPALAAADAILEAADAGVALIICIAEGIPVLDMVKVRHYLSSTNAVLVGPNTPGVISPGAAKAGIMPANIHTPGTVGVVSRSGTLTYAAVDQLTRLGLGQSTAIGIGGDPIVGTGFVDVLQRFEADPGTEAVVLIGEIGGNQEEEAARYVEEVMSKPVVAFIAGRTAPPGRRMGHAGAIVSGGRGTAAEKIDELRKRGICVVENPTEIGYTMKRVLEEDK
ncbi:MAG: succinate--CoA ligase subunit alpha [Acidobacteriota bacterium]|jgi:succinyl-CoA synthetase alpha subunit|nr:succinate--CoA ligase subunit alpha [Acidobacteriota bacterium]